MQTRAKVVIDSDGRHVRQSTSETGVTTPKINRRMTERFDVLGSLWGVLEIPETAAVVNSSDTGMLVESTACPVLDSVQVARVDIDGVATPVQSAVRHVRPVERGKYLVGLEFVKPPVLKARLATDDSRSRADQPASTAANPSEDSEP